MSVKYNKGPVLRLNVIWLAAILLVSGDVFSGGEVDQRANAQKAPSFDQHHTILTNLLKNYVKRGKVDYAGLKKNRGSLDQYLAQLASVSKADFTKFTRNEKLAFYINAYNAFTLKLVTDHYPIKSIRDIGGGGDAAWTQNHVHLGNLFGEKTSLSHLENKVIRARFREPRIHFALVCAAKGCPPLISKAYVPEKLGAQLSRVTKNFIRDTKKNRYDTTTDTLNLSKIFEWYRDDFGGEDGLSDYFSKHGQEDAVKSMQADRKNGKRLKISFLKYDWNLND